MCHLPRLLEDMATVVESRDIGGAPILREAADKIRILERRVRELENTTDRVPEYRQPTARDTWITRPLPGRSGMPSSTKPNRTEG